MPEIGLEFLPNPGGEAEGLSDAGIETFRDKPFAAVARETGQNSRDARLDPEAPVRVTFDVVTLPSSEFPSIDEFREAVALCLAKAEKTGGEKETGFFRHALNTLEAPEIRILRVSDSNTMGVRGPCVEGTPFHTLAKTDGMSVKEEVDAGGSFGIGKSAVFALSDIQTAFFSTRYTNDAGAEEVLCMGKTLFISHTGADGQEKRRKGYWGKREGYLPLDNEVDIPQWLLRKEQGTSIFSICMRSHRTDWRYEMAAAILINFFCAIQRQEMEFEIDDGSIKINRSTLQGFFNDPGVNEAVDQLNARSAFDAARTLHECLVDQKAASHILEVPELGRVRMRMLMRERLNYTIGITRNGMYITDNLANFNEPFKRFPLHREFAVIIEPHGKTESEWFKRVENPRHDNLAADRLTDPELRERGERAFRHLAKQIRDTIKSLAKSEPISSIELEEMNDFFAAEDERTPDDDAMERDPRSFEATPVRPSAPRPPRIAGHGGDDDVVPGPFPDPDPNPDEPRPDPPEPGPEPHPHHTLEAIRLHDERALMPDAGNARKRRLLFTSPVSAEVTIYVDATGLSATDRMHIVDASEGRVENGKLVLNCGKGQRVSVTVEFESDYSGPVELAATCPSELPEAAE